MKVAKSRSNSGVRLRLSCAICTYLHIPSSFSSHHNGGVPSRLHNYVVLSVLYFNQGVPYGFFLLTLPILLRQQGASATVIGSLAFLALPWSLKILWAPWVDRTGSDRFGRRRSWVFPLQLLLAAALSLLAFTLVPWQLALGVFVVNMLVATQDIAVDAYAVERLTTGERGIGNSIQASAYKVGMLVGGGAVPAYFLGADAATGWKPTLLALAALTLPALAAAVLMREPRVTTQPTESRRSSPWSNAYRDLWRALASAPGAIWLAAFALTAKFGDNVGTGMFRVFLVDHGWGADRITTVVSSYGLIASIAGSMLMVIPLQRLTRWGAFTLAALAQAACLFGVAAAAMGILDEPMWAPLLVFEHFASGLVTTVLFTILMDHTPLEYPGSGFTALSVLASLGMGGGSLLGGILVDLAGFSATFVTAGTLVLVPIVLMSQLESSIVSKHYTK